ncbi:hypothetical protein [Kangiella shandongensis]|uniref:hypothetical protein n=1 Tax=Kangiella shandongensis TaxID=2763258 RepID=UPI001CBBFD13|nr:hypothetical protein [Kangiella shandongensis]
MSHLFKVVLSIFAFFLAAGQAEAGKLEVELSQARQATALYHNLDNALIDGYVDIGVYVPGMGHHYLNFSYVDDAFEVDKPEVLVYANSEAGGKLRLVALEYLIPAALSASAPEGFTGDEDHWHINQDINMWALHAWIWYHNPDGVFSDLNDRVD